MLPSWRRNRPCRYGRCLSENKTLGVHLPIKIELAVLDACTVFIVFCLLRKRLREVTTPGFALAIVSACQCSGVERN
jgi:hypothetical protein